MIAFSLGLELGIWSNPRVYILNQPGFRMGQRGKSTNESLVRNRLTASQAAKIHSKHGVILSCSITAEDVSDATKLEDLGHELAGQKYGFFDKETNYDGCARVQEVRRWLKEETS